MPYRNPIQHSMLRRAAFWDYRAPRIYMITITLQDRSRPLLGEVVVSSPANTRPEDVKAFVRPSPLGEEVIKCWNTISVLHPEIRLLGFQLMEEHLHGVLHVQKQLPRPLGNIVGGFKSACTTAFRQLSPGQGDKPLFAPGFQDTILSGENQLERMLHYLQDNPRRAAIRRLFPEFFHHLRDIPFGDGSFTGVGNAFLLEAPLFHQVQASRRITDGEFQQKQREMMAAVKGNAVVVSPCISPAEKELARIAFDSQSPLIVLKNIGFSPLFKPSGAYFDACANGRLLMLAPSQWPYTPARKPMTRMDACVLNALAQQICGSHAAEIHYAGFTPENIAELVNRAMRPSLRR